VSSLGSLYTGVRDLVSLPGVAHGYGRDELVHVRAPASAFPIIFANLGYDESDVTAHLEHFDAATGEAVLTIAAEDGRVALIISGLSHSLASLEELTLPPVLPTRPEAFGYHTPLQGSFDLQLDARLRPLRRRRRLRITR
jgi:hypothetical protein